STCRPEDENTLRKDGSYPSGHTAYGTLLALVLSQARPERAQELARRGWEFGQSRVICGAHWQSDVDAGRYVGAVEFARLQTIPAFQKS
ncbi:TPA_asm: non-specific acid phosphatase, partial [Salmonella enterica subsp. salamae serovar 48:d:z6]|nr:non-specific acid phosphatase [Salmonella enterica subsp. salamae serovar 48:d:z6]HAE3253025.1 non-specific acid phosphatase [Salmonella enterica subsp. salamae serovar 48:d:z6]HAE7840899.1 non-specific acid phosphatase [Salmonella enterica subsp. salamae serovar 48:d:z6]